MQRKSYGTTSPFNLLTSSSKTFFLILQRNGADFAVFINTGQEFDGSDSGARPDEAVSWGKIKKDARHVKLYADATLVFPLIVAQSFAKSVGWNK
jgi:deoxyhypusine synthase